MASKTTTITLSPVEMLLCELLLNCRAALRAQGDAAAATLDIYITGGWVRDRLLGIASHDVDLALSSMTGKQFADALTAYFFANRKTIASRAAELGVPEAAVTCTNFNTTKQNPGKSKNLETAVGRIFGLDLDLVNLRKEVYDDDASRTPVMEFGTAEEDASRRDATVNALFFDVDARRVVDHTGRGLADMAAGIMRTPLAPRQTFLDDPLRVLRLVRMAAKLGYVLDPDARAWMSHPEIHSALAHKVSRERFGTEVIKMAGGNNPDLAMRLLWECGLWEGVFLGAESVVREALRGVLPGGGGAPASVEGGVDVGSNTNAGANTEAGVADAQAAQSATLGTSASDPAAPASATTPATSSGNTASPPTSLAAAPAWPPTWPRAYTLLAALLRADSPLGHMIRDDPVLLPDPKTGVKNHSIASYWLVAALAPVANLPSIGLVRRAVVEATEALKLTQAQTKLIDASLTHRHTVHAALISVREGAASRGDIGMALRAWGSTWRMQLVYALLADVVHGAGPGISPVAESTAELSNDDLAAAAAAPYDAFLARVAADDLWGALDARPLLGGKEVMKLYGVKGGGPWLKNALDELVCWAFDERGRADAPRATEWLVEEKERLMAVKR